MKGWNISKDLWAPGDKGEHTGFAIQRCGFESRGVHNKRISEA